jgi:SAM-dependent methyltransferase
MADFSAAYDRIGVGYTMRRRPDPRLAAMIHSAVGDGTSILNVGAGTGSYEPTDRCVVAVEPSRVMLSGRSGASAPAVQAIAELLPFGDGAFDATMAVLTIHHWADARSGLEECRRVSRRRVILLTWDPESDDFWLVQDYLPDLVSLDRTMFPSMPDIRAVLGPIDVRAVPIPADCVDGFLGAYWRRPEAYLDPEVRACISSFTRAGDFAPGLERLKQDIASGVWAERHADLLRLSELDLGYRLIVAESH